MKTKYLDTEIERLNILERNEELTDWGKEMLTEFKEIKQALLIPRITQAKRAVCPDCGDTGEIRNDKEEIIRSCPCHYC